MSTIARSTSSALVATRRQSMIRHGLGRWLRGESRGSAGYDPGACAVFRGACIHDETRGARAGHRETGRGDLQDPLFACFACGARVDHLGLRALSRDRLDRRLVSAEGTEAYHARADAARGHPGGRILLARAHLCEAE